MFDVRRLLGLKEGQIADIVRKQGLPVERGIFIEKYTVIKYRNADMARLGKPYDVLSNICERGLNCLLNAGITQVWHLLIASDADSFATPQIGVGSTATAADPVQTNLLDGSAAWAAMEGGFPAVAGSIVTFQGQFADGVAQFHWQECAVRQAGVGTTVLNRVVADKGTKAAGEVWSAKEQITLT